MLIKSNVFSFCHNVFKCHLLQRRQKMSTCIYVKRLNCSTKQLPFTLAWWGRNCDSVCFNPFPHTTNPQETTLNPFPHTTNPQETTLK